MSTVVLDNEAVVALVDAQHRKHRRVVAHIAGVVGRRRRGAGVSVTVPTAVRVEARWDRSNPGSAAVNRYRVTDAVLDGRTADVAAAIHRRIGIGVADAHVAAVVRSISAGTVVVLTSDPADIVRAAAPAQVTVVRI